MLKQQFQLKLLQKLSPQQIQLMKLIQLPTQAFEQRIKQEIEENPALSSEKEAEENDNSEYDDLGGESNETEDFDIDAYLSDDEIPSYKLQTNNYSSDDDEHRIPYVSLHQDVLPVVENNCLHLRRKRVQLLLGQPRENGHPSEEGDAASVCIPPRHTFSRPGARAFTSSVSTASLRKREASQPRPS